ncbi:hypothetical protein [Marinicella meishanensis]|uniref:hypothetical protein n=1 Tax=Marinicella meishanensis TaxID=2873263 RepID=UPI001CBF813F|nr:hypothetical protein [Marinicella sp. NBU2979]
MKILMALLMVVSFAAVAGPEHKNHKKGGWMQELGLTEAQMKEVKSIKKAKHEKLMAYKDQLATETDDELAAVLSADQMNQLQAMRDRKENHMAAKSHKKHKKGRGD